ncbi:serine/threonine-protein kinase [Aestuariimicrobium ganziense]|uniref:serine/threonine-protein kinase n=1 Tax=Aestuariimicrobium ganziense TaxID=2773677 RepID=UPI001941C32B|nr:serine/threonine-protein kinase [Aestuariimicrobium ganziense]
MERIGRYRVAQRIGAGSFATVHKGHDDDLDVPVAIKVLSPQWAQHEDVRRRFVTEAQLLRRIRDERIVRVYDIGTTLDGSPYFVMDYADGGSLERLRKNLVAPGRALRLCAEAGRALEVLHRHNVIHRDVTPGNVLLSHSAAGLRVLLADLGVSESLVEKSGLAATAGTPAFMALEQATGQALDHRSDIYSLAAVTYALLTGHAPFPIKTLQHLLERNPNVGPPPIADRLGGPRELDNLLADALSPHPERRPQSAEQFAAALDAFAAVMPGGETYAPRPLDPAGGSSLPPTHGSGGSGGSGAPLVPVAPNPYASSEGAAPMPIQGLHEWSPSSMHSYRSQVGHNSITPRNETPGSMLDAYLGKGRYTPAPVKERHTIGFYVVVALAVLAVFGLTMFLTITYLLN